MKFPVTKATASAALLAVLVFALAPAVFAQAPSKLLITQVEVRGGFPGTNLGEYIVISNPGSEAVNLDNYYLTDATRASADQFYYNLPDTGRAIGGGAGFDFVARFPAGAVIQPGAELSIAVSGSDGFENAYGLSPNFELFEDGDSADTVPDMREARPGSVVDNELQLPSLSNSGEVVILFYWDGASDLVTDIDYVVWGDLAEAIDKTGIAIDGPDADGTATTYAPDTPVGSQMGLEGSPAGTFIRTDLTESTQTATGSNGVDGRDETSENLAAAFTANSDGTPPGIQPVDTTPPSIVSASGSAGATTVTVVFSEPVGVGAGTASNYTVELFGKNDPLPVAVTSAEVGGDPTTVTLTLASALESSSTYRVTATGVQDLAGNPIGAGGVVTFATGGAPGAFNVLAAYRFGPSYIGVAFSDAVNSDQALNTGNYAVTFNGAAPSVGLTGAVLQENGRTVVLRFAGPLPASTAVGVTVSGVTSSSGTALGNGGPFAFTTGTETITAIADIQASPASFEGQTVTVIGQVFIPVGARGGTPSGYLQDGSGRGMNLFGGDIQAAVNDRGNVAKVTGAVTQFFTTTEVENYTATLMADGLPPLGAKVLTVAQANSSDWEGTFIEVTSTLSQIVTSGVGTGSVNFVGSDGGADITYRRQGDTLPIDPNDFQVGDEVTGRGAGGAFQSTFQILLGSADDFFKGSGQGDTTPPALVTASGEGGETRVSVVFSEPVAEGGGTPSNYSVAPSADPTASIAVTSVSVGGSSVTLNLATALEGGTSYTVTVSNVQDTAGNVIPAGSSVSFTAGAGTAFAVTGVFQFGADYVGIGFSKKVNAGQATTTGNYAFTPALDVSSIAMQANGRIAIVKTAADLPLAQSYSVTVNGVTSSTGESLAGNGPFSFATAATQVTNIEDVQLNAADLDGQPVTVIGSVFIPTESRGGTASGYIQDGSGRGVNLFGRGSTPIVNTLGNVVLVDGSVAVFFTTTEVENYTATLLAADQPRLGARILSVAEANSSEWEGTYIETTADLTDIITSGVGTGDINFIGADGTDQIIFRWQDGGLDINPGDFQVGDRVTGRGAGSAFQTSFQIQLGNSDDFFKVGGEDTTPPELAGASAEAEGRDITVTFTEPVAAAGATQTGNYEVFATENPGDPLAVTRALLGSGARSVTLTVNRNLEINVGYTVRVSGVTDLAGNPIAQGSVITFVAKKARPKGARITVPAATLIKNLRGEGEIFPVEIEGELDSKAVCRVFDLQGRMVKVLFDGRFNGSTKKSLEWDGRDETFEFVPAGMYVCHLSTTDLNGKVTEAKAPIVVSVRLK